MCGDEETLFNEVEIERIAGVLYAARMGRIVKQTAGPHVHHHIPTWDRASRDLREGYIDDVRVVLKELGQHDLVQSVFCHIQRLFRVSCS